MLDGGVDPGLLDEVRWWRTDVLWYWSLEALAAHVRAADRTVQPVASVCRRTAEAHDITLTDDVGERCVRWRVDVSSTTGCSAEMRYGRVASS
jgi:hypothetical protein